MEDFEILEAYINGTLSKDEATNVEARLKTDSVFNEEYESLKTLQLGVESFAFKKALGNKRIGSAAIEEEKETKVVSLEPKKRNYRTILSIAAIFLGVVACGLWLFSPDNTLSTDEQFAAVYYDDPGLPTRMSSDTKEYDFYDAMVDFKAEKYQTAFDKWNTVKTGIGTDTLNFYKGYAQLKLGNIKEAKSLLTQVNNQSDINTKTQWYLSEILVKEGNYEEAIAILKTIKSDLYDTEKAIQLIEAKQ